MSSDAKFNNLTPVQMDIVNGPYGLKNAQFRAKRAALQGSPQTGHWTPSRRLIVIPTVCRGTNLPPYEIAQGKVAPFQPIKMGSATTQAP
jgi:hypothetical protein